MNLQKVFEALEDALRTKDMLIAVYTQERDEARKEVAELRRKIANLEGAMDKKQTAERTNEDE